MVSLGSKSEHPAVLLVSEAGRLKLRRPAGNPFHDPVLEELVGKEVVCEGEVQSGQFILSNWRIIG